MKTKLSVACLLMCFGLVGHAFAAMGELKEPNLAFPKSFPEAARAKINAVLRRPDCKFVSGMWLNSYTYLKYSGDTVPLNLFLEGLAACPGISLSIRFDNKPEETDWDWAVQQDGSDPTRLCVRVNLNSSRVKIVDLVVPEYGTPSLLEKK